MTVEHTCMQKMVTQAGQTSQITRRCSLTIDTLVFFLVGRVEKRNKTLKPPLNHRSTHYRLLQHITAMFACSFVTFVTEMSINATLIASSSQQYKSNNKNSVVLSSSLIIS
ncbi:hypothetical protein D917_04074 [Trichinella nativa]|uniref:Uncharacterized protein n=1 Tax=Trichinella nativa TaxID=6335 RepID=A0A1Y3E6X8_9BILA|nr:hypothetical protein D917_04074 [Trichinella nativa]